MSDLRREGSATLRLRQLSFTYAELDAMVEEHGTDIVGGGGPVQ